MTTIRVTCRTCEDHHRLTEVDITVVRVGKQTWARFTCPDCRRIGLRVITPRTADLLAAAGCAEQRITKPVRERPRSTKPISDTEQIALIWRLRGITNAEELTA